MTNIFVPKEWIEGLPERPPFLGEKADQDNGKTQIADSENEREKEKIFFGSRDFPLETYSQLYDCKNDGQNTCRW